MRTDGKVSISGFEKEGNRVIYARAEERVSFATKIAQFGQTVTPVVYSYPFLLVIGARENTQLIRGFSGIQ